MFTLVIPFHSDRDRLPKTINDVVLNATKYKIDEVLLCHNGGSLSESVKSELAPYCSGSVRLLSTADAGIGAGYKLGIENAKSHYCVLSASDLPFGFTDIGAFLKQQNVNHTLLFAVGSKAHKGSRVKQYGLIRKLASFCFWLLRCLFLGTQTPKDSQGSLIVQTALAQDLAQQCEYNNYFFSLEIITLAQLKKIKVIELPVRLENNTGASSVSLWRDSVQLLKDLWKFSRRVQKLMRSAR